MHNLSVEPKCLKLAHSRAAPFYLEEEIFLKKHPKFSQFLICILGPYINQSQIDLFQEINHNITYYKTLEEYFIISNLKTDEHVKSLCNWCIHLCLEKFIISKIPAS